LDHGTAVTATHLLVAVGRKPPATDLALGAVGVDVDDRGYIRTDNHLATALAASMRPVTSPAGCS
jgi:pyruvate/2-oxoglutarate dehydrogenase complex dihydrolipoamide dehydrogenase (E3) component